MFRKANCLILEYIKLPKSIMNVISEWCGFHNDCLLKVSTEFTVSAYKEGMKAIKDYWKDQVKTNNYKGTLEKFIKDYGLEFDVWFIEQKFDITGVDEILIDICW
jgi:hypothetical protein